MRILLIKGKSRYNALRIFLDEAQQAFEALGHAVVMLDLMDAEVERDFARLVVERGPFDLAFSYGIYGDFFGPDGRNIGQLIGAPHIVQHVDHPCSHLAQLRKTHRNAVVLTVDQSHADLIRIVFGSDYFAYVGFNPHAAIGAPVELPATGADYLASRPIQFMFAGTYYRPDVPPWSEVPANVQAVFSDAADIALSYDWFAPHLALIEAMRMRGLPPDNENTRTLLPHANAVHEWVRSHRRFQFLKAAAKAKLPVTLFGDGYDKDLYRFKSMDYRGPADFHEIVGHMRASRILLNVNVNFGEGSHERPLSAMLAGAVAVTEPSTFYDTFRGGADDLRLGYFRWSTLDDDLARVRDLAEDGDTLLTVARNAQQEALAHHTWRSRAERIIEIAAIARTSPQWTGA